MPRHARTLLLLAAAFLYLPFVYLYGAKLAGGAHTDFPSFYFGARVAFGQDASPYAADAFAAAQVALDQRVFPYLYPPPSLPLFYPFTLVDYETAKKLMLATNHLVLLGWLYLLLFKILRVDLKTAAGIAAAFFFLLYARFFHPLAVNFDHGQINLVVIALLSLTWYALQRERPYLAAAPLAMAIVLKTYPVLFLPLLLRRGRYRILAWVGVWLVGFAALAAATLPVEVWRDWALNIAPTGGYAQTPAGLFSPALVHNQSVNGFAARLFLPNEFNAVPFPDPQLARLAAYVLAALIVGAGFLLIYRAARLPRPQRLLDLEFALVLLTMYLVAPLSWMHHLVYVLPAVFVALYRLLPWERNYLWGTVVAGSTFVLAWNLPFDFPSLGAGITRTLMMSLKFYAVAALWAYTAWRLYRAIAAERDVERAEGESGVDASPGPIVAAGAQAAKAR